MSTRKTLRCAIYTRVSTEHGLEQEFNSLDAQREACAAFIKSQLGEGWRLTPTHYDDGGYSGGSMARPALQRLRSDIEAGTIDVVVVYKVDRLTRSLADFAKLVELFDQQGVSFVSVTQSFNTTSSMGRLTLNVLLSFAQFEREVTGERIRDKIAASKKKGLRVGGPVPLGYSAKDKKLVIEPGEADTVRMIFERYLEVGSLTALVLDLAERGVRTKRSPRRDGTIRGDVPFRKGALAFLLRNRAYLGEIVHKGRFYRGEHEAIVPAELFQKVQERLDEQTQNDDGIRVNTASPLIGRLFDDRGNRMTPATTNKRGIRYRYYVSTALVEGRREAAGSVPRVPAADIEAVVGYAVMAKLGRGSGQQAVEASSGERDAFPWHEIRCVTIKSGTIDINLDDASNANAALLTVPWSLTAFRRRRELIATEGEIDVRPIRSETRARLVEGIALAKTWLDELMSGRVTSTHAIAKREKLSERSVRMTLNLAFLSPTLMKAAVDGTLPRRMGICNLANADLEWSRQDKPLRM
jgi:DNA invertase Pin-like site-specific DNA recombinase